MNDKLLKDLKTLNITEEEFNEYLEDKYITPEEFDDLPVSESDVDDSDRDWEDYELNCQEDYLQEFVINYGEFQFVQSLCNGLYESTYYQSKKNHNIIFRNDVSIDDYKCYDGYDIMTKQQFIQELDDWCNKLKQCNFLED